MRKYVPVINNICDVGAESDLTMEEIRQRADVLAKIFIKYNMDEGMKKRGLAIHKKKKNLKIKKEREAQKVRFNLSNKV